jgi:hypothetical protein
MDTTYFYFGHIKRQKNKNDSVISTAYLLEWHRLTSKYNQKLKHIFNRIKAR